MYSRPRVPPRPADARSLHGSADQDPAAGHGVRHPRGDRARRPLRTARAARHHDI